MTPIRLPMPMLRGGYWCWAEFGFRVNGRWWATAMPMLLLMR